MLSIPSYRTPSAYFLNAKRYLLTITTIGDPASPEGIPMGKCGMTPFLESFTVPYLLKLALMPYFPLYLIERDLKSKLFKLSNLLCYFLDSLATIECSASAQRWVCMGKVFTFEPKTLPRQTYPPMGRRATKAVT